MITKINIPKKSIEIFFKKNTSYTKTKLVNIRKIYYNPMKNKVKIE